MGPHAVLCEVGLLGLEGPSPTSNVKAKTAGSLRQSGENRKSTGDVKSDVSPSGPANLAGSGDDLDWLVSVWPDLSPEARSRLIDMARLELAD